MKRIVSWGALTLLFFACGPEPQKETLTYKNLVILTDMSSRLDNRPPKDIQEIRKLITFFEKECVMPSEKIGDKSAISFSLFSEEVCASIDLGTFKNLGEKQQFVNSTGEYVNTGLAYQIKTFENVAISKYGSYRNYGLDLISILLERIEKGSVIKRNIHLTDGIDTTFINYDNHIYIFTDGYLEYLNPGVNRQFYFGSQEIEKVRQYCKDHQVTVVDALEANNSMCLPVIKDKQNWYINLHILETHERDFDTRNQTYLHQKGMRDNEILEAVWRKWAMESGFKSLEWKKY